MPEDILIRPRRARLGAVITWVLCAGLVVTAILAPAYQQSWRWVIPAAAVAWFAWSAFWRPGIVIGPSGIRVRNVLSDSDVAWPAVRDVETSSFLRITTTSRERITVWAAPMAGGAGIEGIRKVQGLSHGVNPVPMDSIRVKSSDLAAGTATEAATIMLREIARRANAGERVFDPRLPPVSQLPGDERATTIWSPPRIAVSALLVLATVVVPFLR